MSTKGQINRLTDAYNQYNTLLTNNQTAGQAAYQPYEALGTQGVNALMNPQSSFTTSPGYQFRLDQGLESATQSKAVGGLLNSGSTLKSLSDYGQNTASSEYNNWYNQQLGLAGIGQNATNSSVGLGTSTANQIGSNAVGLATGVNTIKSNAAAATNSLWGSVLGSAAAIATGNPLAALGSLKGLSSGGSTGGGAYSAIPTGTGWA